MANNAVTSNASTIINPKVSTIMGAASLNAAPIKDSLLFTYTGIIKIKNTLASSPKGEKVSSAYLVNSPNWEDEQAIGTFDVDTTNWGDMKDNKKSGSVRRNRVNIPIKGGLKTDGGLYYLGEREYKGAYHIHEDLGVAMTGSTYNKNSKILSRTCWYSSYLEKDSIKLL